MVAATADASVLFSRSSWQVCAARTMLMFSNIDSMLSPLDSVNLLRDTSRELAVKIRHTHLACWQKKDGGTRLVALFFLLMYIINGLLSYRLINVM